MRNPYEYPFKDTKGVKYFKVESLHTGYGAPNIISVIWSSVEKIEFGKLNSVRPNIFCNEHGFLHIHTHGMYGKFVNVEICEDDTTGDIVLTNYANQEILNNVLYLPIDMSVIHGIAKRERSCEGSDYEIYAKVTPVDSRIAPKKSEILLLSVENLVAKLPKKSTKNGVSKCTIGSSDVSSISGVEKDDKAIDFHIYSDTKTIEKHIPSGYNESSGTILKYRYYYHHKGKLYLIITLNGHLTQKYSNGSKAKPGSGEYVTKKNNDDIDIYFKKDQGEIVLVQLPEVLNQKVEDRLIKYNDRTDRNYVSPDVAASLIGALSECSFDYIVFNGCTDKEGIGDPSVSHARGYNIDFRYIRKDRNTDARLDIKSDYNDMDLESQNTFIDALKVFGWSDPRGHNPNNSSTFHVTHLSGHSNHLHCQGYDSSIIKSKIK